MVLNKINNILTKLKIINYINKCKKYFINKTTD